MLDFLLVLGLIPGTDFQITFYELITISLVLIGWLFRAQLRRLIAAKRQLFMTWFKLKLWQRRQLSLPV
jgi:hypothetical protein